MSKRKQDKSKPINSINNNPCTNNMTYQKINYFITGPGMEAYKEVSAKKKLYEYGNIFTTIGCFKGAFSLQVKDDSKQYASFLRYVAYTLQEPFQKRKRLQEQQIQSPLEVDDMDEWCNSFDIVPQPNGTV